MARKPQAGFHEFMALEMRRICSLQEASRLCGLSDDTLRRVYRDKLIKLSKRRWGMRVGDALNLTASEKVG
jgi:hypothetical protein